MCILKMKGEIFVAQHMLRNIGIGMAAGAALGMALAPRKKVLKATARKARQTVEDIADNMTRNWGM